MANQGEQASAFAGSSGIILAQGDGGPPNVLLAATAPGQHGVSIIDCRFERGIHVCGTSLHHVIFLLLSANTRFDCRIDEKRLDHVASAGNLTICPAGASCAADGESGCEGLVLLIPRDSFAFTLAERLRPGASLVECLKGEDKILLSLGLSLAQEASDGFINGPLAWNALTDTIIDRLAQVHLSETAAPIRGRLPAHALSRVTDFVHANVDRQFDVDRLADIAQQSRSHFPRLFRRSIGLSPYQYVMKVRLERARALIRQQDFTLSETALLTGFADQSHLCRWIRRVYGASPTQLAA